MNPQPPIYAQYFKTNTLANGLRSSEFHLECIHEEWQPQPSEPDASVWYHEIITEFKYHDLKVSWTIMCEYYQVEGVINWMEIELKESNKHVFGTMTAKASTTGHFLSESFDSNYIFRPELPDIELDTKRYSKININFCIFYNEYEPLFTLAADYEKFLDNQELCDVTFVLEDGEIPAHKQIIAARNQVFASMFKNQKKSVRIEVTDVETEIFKLLLRYIYCEKVDFKDLDFDDALELIVVANKYSVRNLVALCAHFIEYKITVDNVVETLMIADIAQVDFLKKSCMKMIAKQEDEVFMTDGYKKYLNPIVQVDTIQDFPLKQ